MVFVIITVQMEKLMLMAFAIQFVVMGLDNKQNNVMMGIYYNLMDVLTVNIHVLIIVIIV